MMKAYFEALESFPIIVNTLTAIFLSALGDIIAQVIEYRKSPKVAPASVRGSALGVDKSSTIGSVFTFDSSRTIRQALWQIPITPIQHYWHILLNKSPSPFFRVLLDQFIWAPVGLAAFICYIGYFKKGTTVEQEFSRSFANILKTNYCFWPFVQIISFTLVYVEHRVLFANLVSLVWGAILSMTMSSSGAKKKGTKYD